MKTNQKKLLEGFKGKKICVVGDIIADVFIFGKPYRLSREAPVVVVKHEEERTLIEKGLYAIMGKQSQRRGFLQGIHTHQSNR
ncbi:MAG: hypothetical protein NTU90_01855 [Proteobacteria bacterium]|nr:hypothetical protein [Pseudomonadota bacterium]